MRATLEQIWLNATQMPKAQWRRNYSQNPRRQINSIVPFLGTKTLLITASFWGLTENSVHLTNILFMDCEIIEEVVATSPKNIQNQTQVEESPNALPTSKVSGGVSNAEPNYSTATHFKVTYQNKNYWVKKIDLRRQNVLVRCSCSDYYHVWSYANYINGLQFGGKSRPYTRKTNTRPPRNPDPRKFFGLCKHLSQLTQMLQTSGYGV